MNERRDIPDDAASMEQGAPERGTPILLSLRGLLSIEGVCGALIIEITALMFAVVIARYVFSVPLIWAEETVRYSFTWLAFLSAAAAMKHGGHIAIELIAAALPAGPERQLKIMVELTVAVFLILLVYYGSQMAIITHGQRSSALGLPMSVVYASGPVGALLMAWYSVKRLFDLIRRKN